jgi:hypothetical protein
MIIMIKQPHDNYCSVKCIKDKVFCQSMQYCLLKCFVENEIILQICLEN